MSTPEPESYAELIADCAAIPAAITSSARDLPDLREAAPWEVGEAAFAQVSNLEEFV